MKKTLVMAAITFLSLSPARADDFTIETTPGWDREVRIMSDFVNRGISQTHGRSSASGTVVYTFSNGVFGGGQATHSTIADQNVQVDVVGGWKTAITDQFRYQASFDYQNYPFTHDHAANNLEFQQIVNYDVSDWATVVAAVTFQPDAQEHAGFQTYSSAGVDFKLPADFSLGGRVGYLTTQVHDVQPNYVDWTVTIARDMGHGITLSAQYTGLTYHCSDCGNRFVAFVNFQF